MFQFFSQLNHIQLANQFDLFDSTCLFVQLNVCSPALVICGVKMCQDVSRCVEVPLHGEGWWLREQDLPVPTDQGAAGSRQGHN